MKAKKSSVINYRIWQIAFVIIVTIYLATLCLGQTQQPRNLDERYIKQPQGGSEPVPTPNYVIDPKQEYRIGPGDVIEVRIDDAPELNVQNARVSPKGTFWMNYLQYIDAKGKTQDELSLMIADKLRGKYLKNPNVSVIIKQPNSQTYIIQGSVRKPGVYQIEGRPSLTKLIGIAGGPMENRGSTAYVIRELKNPVSMTETTGGANESSEPIKYEMLSCNLSAFYKGRFDQDIRLEPGDTVNIPEADVFFVSGEVNFPGSFPLKEGTTLRQAIAMAQGTTIKAKAKDAIIFRENEKGQREEIRVDIDAVAKGKKEDIRLMANDIIAVPNSPLKSALLPILNAAGSGLGMTTGSTIIRR